MAIPLRFSFSALFLLIIEPKPNKPKSASLVVVLVLNLCRSFLVSLVVVIVDDLRVE